MAHRRGACGPRCRRLEVKHLVDRRRCLGGLDTRHRWLPRGDISCRAGLSRRSIADGGGSCLRLRITSALQELRQRYRRAERIEHAVVDRHGRLPAAANDNLGLSELHRRDRDHRCQREHANATTATKRSGAAKIRASRKAECHERKTHSYAGNDLFSLPQAPVARHRHVTAAGCSASFNSRAKG